jgi:hypothetical protein
MTSEFLLEHYHTEFNYFRVSSGIMTQWSLLIVPAGTAAYNERVVLVSVSDVVNRGQTACQEEQKK